MQNPLLQSCKSSLVQVFFVALAVLLPLQGRVAAQQGGAPASPAVSSTTSSASTSTPGVPQIIQFNGQFNAQLSSQSNSQSGATLGGGSATVPSGTVSITFTLYENEQGGTALWSETQNVQVDAQGHYTALLGSTSPEGLPVTLFTNVQAHWLAVQPLLPDFAEQPRVLLVSAPYALKAGDAETVGGLPPSAFVQVAPGTSSASGSASSSSGSASVGSTGVSPGQPVKPPLSGSGTTNYIPLWTSSTALGNSKLYQTGGNVGIGTTTPAYQLDVVGRINTNALYKIGGSTVLAMPGGSSGGNIAVGYQALVNNTTGLSNTASGAAALNGNTTGSDNTASGYQALVNNTTGNFNTASGILALYSNTTGNYNTAIGSGALSSNITGSYNTVSGSGALVSNTTGSYNTASGVNTLFFSTTGDNNAASGYQALALNTTGSDNAANGYQALYSNTTGFYNTASGDNALFANTTGCCNIAIGNSAASAVSGGNSGNIHIGNMGGSFDSGVIRIGTSGYQISFFVAGVRGVATGLNNAVPILIDSNGQLGTVSSSRRFKEDIQDMGEASEGLMRLRPVTFRYKQPFDDGSKPIQYGLVAEEVAEVYPDLIARSADGQIETVKYQLLDPMLLNEVQREHAEVQRQQAEIRGLIKTQKEHELEHERQLKGQQALVLNQQIQLRAQQAQIRELASQMKTIQSSLRDRRGSAKTRITSAHGQPAPDTINASLPVGSAARGGN